MSGEDMDRLQQIRQQVTVNYGDSVRGWPTVQMKSDIDFLLSLVKEQEGDDYIRGAYESICGPVRDAAATAMRSACIKRLKELAADVEHGDALLSAKAVITELESLSIEKPKE